jgi:hypothetical protein
MEQGADRALAGMQRPPSPQSIIAFSPSANRFYAGGLTFSPDDVPSALQASQRLSQPTPPAPGNIAGDWQFVSPQQFGQYMQGLRAPRTALQNVGLGFRGGLEGAIGGIGRAAELAGATETGPAIAGFAERAFGQTPQEQARSALIQQSNSLWSNILDATAQGVGSLAPTILGGLAGAAIGGPAGAAIGATSAASRSVGALAGVAAATFPMELKGFYDAAQKNGYNVNDPGVQGTMLASAFGTTLIQSLAPATVIKGLSGPFRAAVEETGQQVARGALRNAASGAARASLQEGFAEAISSLAQNVIFDPEFRRKMSANDWKVIGPYVAEKYGEEALISFGAGALLGGAFGGAANFRGTKPIDLNQEAGRRAEEVQGPPEQQGPPAPPPTQPPTQPLPTPDELSAAAWEQSARMAMQPAQLGLAPYGESAALGEAWMRATAPPEGPPAPPREQYGPPEQQGPLIPPPTRQYGPAPAFIPPAPEPTRTGVPQFQPIPQVSFEGATPTQRAAGFGPSEGPLAPGLRRLLRQREATEAEAQRILQEQEAAAARTAAAEPEMRTQAALEERTVLDTEGASTGKNKLQDDSRRRTIAGFNNLTVEQQNRVLAEFDNDPQQFFAYVRRTETKAARRSLARAAGVEPEAFNVKTPAPAEPQPAAQPVALRRGEPSATEEGVQPQGGLRKRADAGQGRPSAKAGGRNRLEQRREEQAARKAEAEVVPTPAPTRGLTPDAVELLAKVDAGGVPGMMTNSLRAIAAKNGVEVTRTMKPADVIAALRDKQEVAPTPPKKPLRPSKPEAPKEGAVKRPPEGEVAPSPKSAAPAETEATATAKANREQLRAVNEELATLQKQVDDIKSKAVSASTSRVDREKMAAARTVAEERIYDLRDQKRNLEALTKGPTVDTPSGPGALVKDAKGKGETGRFSLRGYNTVTGATGLNGQKLPPMAVGRVTIGVRRFLSNLATKPKVTIFRDQADLKAKNPALYRQARAAAGPNVDFDAAPAAGYSFGDGNVIIFSDSIANDQHLNFVLAHETLGHFGMRGIMPGPKFNALMETLYDENPRIKAGVDNAMEARGLRKAEAVEEYLSDYAGMLETSVVLRVWNGIKGFLNKLGVRFGDEAMRYFLDQSKRYVRQGQQGVAFDAQAVADRLLYVETGANNTGRFSMGTVRTAHDQLSEVLQSINPRRWTSFEENYQALRSLNITRREGWNDFLDRFTRLTNFKAMDNPGLYAFHQLLTAISQKSRFFLNKYDSELRSLMNASKAHQDNVSRVLFGGRNIADTKFRKNPIVPRERLLSLDADGTPTVDRARLAKLVQQYALTIDEARNGASETVEVTDSLGNIQRDTAKHDGVEKLTQQQYDDYIKSLKTLANVEADLLEAKYKALLDTDDISRKAIKRIMKAGDFTQADAKFVDDTIKEAKRIYVIGKTIDANGLEQLDPQAEARSNDFLAAVNAALLGKDTDRNAEVAAFFAAADAGEAYVKQLMNFKSRRKPREELAKDKQDLTFQDQVKFIVLQSVDLDAAEYNLKWQVVTNNISVLREGGHESRTQAFINGKPVELAPEYQEKTVFSLFKTAGEATAFADKFNASMQDQTFSAIVMENGVPVMRDNVTFRAIPGRALQVATTDPSTNLNDFLHLLRRFNMVPDPKAMADIVTALTNTTDSARKRMLQYSQTPGYDPTLAVHSLSTRVYSRANVSAKTLYAPEMRRLMDRTDPEMDALWRGGLERVIALKKEVDAATGEAKAFAQRELDRALRQFKATNPDAKGKDGKPWDGSEKNAPDVGKSGYRRAEVYYNEAGRTMATLETTTSIAESDLEASRVISYTKAFTSLALLSITPAQGALNISTAYTHWAHFMASYSAENAFGGGFGLGPSLAAYHRAMNQIGYRGIYVDTKFNTAEFYDQVATDTRLQKQTGLNAREARFVAREIREGKLIPAQSNAMLSTALRQFTSPGLRKFADAIMTPFNYSEQAVRRGAGLAAYRLAYDRAIAAGKSETVADETAREFALTSIDSSFGDYDMLNRPPAWRQGIPGLLYMYKVFPTMTVQLLANLSPMGKVGMLLGLWALAGVGGLPFAEDIEDLIDTLAQKANLTSRGLRIEMGKLLDDIIPGMSPVVFKGVVSTLLGSPADIGSRFSVGDLIPGTGILLAGAKASEEFKDIAGPAASVVFGMPAFAANLIRAPFSDTMTLEAAARSSPITALRILGDTSAYLNTGAVVDKRGYVVSQDMNAATIITRLLGFYPSAAAEQYDVIKYANRLVNYQKEMTTTYREAWIKAKLRGDEAGAARIAENVVDWNDATRGTGLEMRNWLAGSNRALREASRPAGERALRAAPTAARQDIRGLIESILD